MRCSCAIALSAAMATSSAAEIVLDDFSLPAVTSTLESTEELNVLTTTEGVGELVNVRRRIGLGWVQVGYPVGEIDISGGVASVEVKEMRKTREGQADIGVDFEYTISRLEPDFRGQDLGEAENDAFLLDFLSIKGAPMLLQGYLLETNPGGSGGFWGEAYLLSIPLAESEGPVTIPVPFSSWVARDNRTRPTERTWNNVDIVRFSINSGLATGLSEPWDFELDAIRIGKLVPEVATSTGLAVLLLLGMTRRRTDVENLPRKFGGPLGSNECFERD